MKTLNEVTQSFNVFVGSLAEQARINKETLVRGSILDPLNHPSYSAEKAEAVKADHAAYEKSLARLNKKHGR